jgi:hypothetical protein
MEDIRATIEKLGKIDENITPISEGIFHWGITDPAEIRAHVMENLVEWQHGNGWERGTFAELLLAYLSALKIDPNESSAMKKVMIAARKEIVNDYKIWVKEDTWLGFADDLRGAISKLRQIGLDGKELSAIEADLAKREQRLNARYEK